jgi:hypothetical protein
VETSKAAASVAESGWQGGQVPRSRWPGKVGGIYWHGQKLYIYIDPTVDRK